MSYRGAGVDLDAAERSVELIRRRAARATRPEVLGDIGGFAGAFAPRLSGLDDPVLVSATDGVGTKLAIAQALDRHDTVGIDLVAMVVDDIACHGAEPLFLLDYIACGRLVPERVEALVAGIAEGCRVAGCALLGGETAEHPGLMDVDAYDLAGFGVGLVARDRMLGPDRVRAGDAIVGLASSGLHSNGYSLVRRLVLDHDLDLAATPPGLGEPLGEALLAPTRIHAPAVLAAAATGRVRAAAHVTGGGIPGNLPRALPRGHGAAIRPASWPEPPIFGFLRDTGTLGEDEMRKTFNVGIGMTLVVAPEHVDEVVGVLEAHGERAFVIGDVREGAGVVFE